MTLTFPTAPSRASATKIEPPSAARLRLAAFHRHLALWTLQAWLSMFFVGAGYAKLTSSSDLLILLLGWPEGVDLKFVRAMGAAELSLAIGIITPLLTWRLAPVMVASALGLIGLAGFSLAQHLGRLEFGFVGLNLVLATAALAVLIGRRDR